MFPDLKCDFSRYVNVKQMDLAVESHQLSYCLVNGSDRAKIGVYEPWGEYTVDVL